MRLLPGSPVKRTLKRLNYVYKQASKTVPANALTPSAKRKQIVAILDQIKSIVLRKDRECEIVFLDESHFSTEPYVVRGRINKGLKNFKPHLNGANSHSLAL